MTLEQIDNLIYTDLIGLLQSRLFIKNDIEPVDTLYFSQEELEAELEIYKDELRAIENERLRKQDLTNRFNSLKDMRASFHSIHSEPNPELWFNTLLESTPVNAESKIAELEAKDLELQPSQKEIEHQTWVEELEAELQKENITKDGLLEALVRDRFLDDPSFIEALKPKLIEINNRKPRK